MSLACFVAFLKLLSGHFLYNYLLSSYTKVQYNSSICVLIFVWIQQVYVFVLCAYIVSG